MVTGENSVPLPQSLRSLLQFANAHAQAGRFADLLAVCQQISEAGNDDVESLLDVGALLLNFGYLTHARQCFERVGMLAPNDRRAQVNCANLAREAGDHRQSRRLYLALQAALPDHPVIRRNALVSQEYDPAVADSDRLQHARAWGDWAIAQAGGWRSRPPLAARSGRPLRIGYVSADLCQHTVGLFLKAVLLAHATEQVTVFAYSAGSVSDWVTDAIRRATTFRDVSALRDPDLAALIRQDAIDVLIDLSGHTAGSRLTVFAWRPAPVLVSWLGYFATTGLPCIDAVLLDDWHAPEGGQAQFVEPVIRLPSGRFCYQPVPWAPADVAPLPYLRNGHITFACFNNTAKYNAGVFSVWARILHAVPGSRLILKWRTLADQALCDSIRAAFGQRGIDPQRLDLRPASFHVELFREYADADIALDPFPFTGGLTSCEALWMGLPVVSWPQSRVVSRQTLALLSAIGLPELAATDADHYVRIAVSLATDPGRLATLRSGLRGLMRASPLMDVAGFTRQLEGTLSRLYDALAENENTMNTMNTMNTRTILHVGPGHRRSGASLPAGFQSAEWREIRLDIDPANEPDLLGSMLEMSAVASQSVDAIYSAHNIEHVYPHQVPVVLGEFLRVLKTDGLALITCPDLQAVCALVADDQLGDPAYRSQAGPITPLDILYGHGAALAAGHLYMAHKCGFTLKTLTLALQSAGFQTIAGKRRASGLDLWVLASKGPMSEDAIRQQADRLLPA